MSWKSVELQVALPRVQDAAKLQEQMAQRNPTLQHFVSQQQIKLDQKRRTQVNKHERMMGVKEENRHSSQPQSCKKEQSLDKEHPYLGKQIDYSG